MTHDRTVDPLFACEGEMARRMAEHDWTGSVLGRPEGWSESLRTAVGIMLRSRYPMILSWGEELAVTYNDAYIPTLGAKHPEALGRSLADVFAEIWDAIGPKQRSVLAGGPATWDEDTMFVLERGDGPEEVFFDFAYSHVPEPDAPGGVLAVVTITTDKVVLARRLALLNRLSRAIGGTDERDEAIRTSMRILGEEAEAEIAFAAVYAPDGDGGLRLLDGVGAPGVGQPALAATLSLEPGHDDPYGVVRAYVSQVGTTVALDAQPGDGRARMAATQSLRDQLNDTPSGVLVLAPNPLRPYDPSSEEFFALVADNVAATISDAASRAKEAERLEALSALAAAKTAFLHNVSHEFRTPLTLLLGPLEDVLAGRIPHLDTAAVESMHGNAHRLLRLVNALLDFARGEAGELELQAQAVDPRALTEDLLQSFRPAIDRAGLGLEVDLADVGPVMLDPLLWEKAVLNLISNALKYTLEGTIRLSLARDGDDVVLSVADSGVGIAEDELGHVFDRFYRVARSDGRSFEGTGIGLSLVADAARLHGGAASVTSVEGEGSTFTMRVPLVPAAADQPAVLAASGARDALIRDAMAWAGTDTDDVTISRVEGSDQRPCVLVVDDNAELRSRVARALSGFADVRTARDGVEALEVIDASPPDIVVTDVMMPRMSGIELLGRLRQEPATATLPVVLLSARAGSEAATEALAAGADDYVTKPFTTEELEARVRTSLELARLREQLAADESRSLLLAGISHDMQTPVSTVLGTLTLMRMGALDEQEQTQLITQGIQRCHQLRRLIQQVVDWSRLSAGEKLPVEVAPTDLVALAHRVVTDAGLAVVITSDHDQLSVEVDPHRTERILHNLLENARRHARCDVQLRIQGSADFGVATVDVVDDGTGVDPALVDRLFTAFAHSDRGRDGHEGQGTGLGLYVSREAAEAQRGSLTLRSSDETGTTFRLQLPLS